MAQLPKGGDLNLPQFRAEAQFEPEATPKSIHNINSLLFKNLQFCLPAVFLLAAFYAARLLAWAGGLLPRIDRAKPDVA
ncbi:MAG TPA: hypothetical protein VHB49_20910 [Bradyrhizobium sp.]|nr:hypothetical protein [Bradyrhizobium sp.]